jgi:hypothetical protein
MNLSDLFKKSSSRVVIQGSNSTHIECKKGTININGQTYNNNSISLINGKLYIDNELVSEDKIVFVTLNVTGNNLEVESTSGTVNVKGSCNQVQTTSGDIEIDGDVTGNCQTVSGNIKANTIKGNCKTVSGDIKTK